MYVFESLTDEQIAVLEERFWKKVDVRGPDDCWLWTASVEGVPGHKYGKIKIPNSRKTVRSNRVAFFLANEADPGEGFVRHHCDNPLCCNPAHLQVGTHLDNMCDMRMRGRASRPFGSQVGTQNKNCKLTESDVLSIRERADEGEPVSRIAKDYGMHPDTMRKIRDRVLWSHI